MSYTIWEKPLFFVFQTLQRIGADVEEECVPDDAPESLLIDYWREDGEEPVDPELKANPRPASKYFGTKHFDSLMHYILPKVNEIEDRKTVKHELVALDQSMESSVVKTKILGTKPKRAPRTGVLTQAAEQEASKGKDNRGFLFRR
jgi:hypothetical protein